MMIATHKQGEGLMSIGKEVDEAHKSAKKVITAFRALRRALGESVGHQMIVTIGGKIGNSPYDHEIDMISEVDSMWCTTDCFGVEFPNCPADE
jgi:hypothetical protein